MKRIILTAILLAFIGIPAMAQPAPETATLTAEGTGTALAEPDVVVVTIGVTTRGDTPAAALEANNANMQAAIDAILAAGVAEADTRRRVSRSIRSIRTNAKATSRNESSAIMSAIR